MKKVRKQTLLDFFTSHNSRYSEVNNNRINSIKNAMPLTEDKGVIAPNQMLVEVLISQFKVLLQGIEQLDKACLLYTSPSPRDLSTSRMPSSA